MSGPLGSQQWMYASGGFYDHTIDNSLRFNDNDSAYLSRTPASAGNRKTWTWSGWVKRGNLNANTVGNIPTLFAAQDSSAGLYNVLEFLNNANNDIIYAQLCSASSAYYLETSQTFRDVAGWYHIVWAVDTTQATASNRAKLYVNGEQVTNFTTAQYPPQNTDTDINYTVEHNIGKFPDYTRYFDGYMAEVNFIDGQQLDPTSFGETKSGIWIPKDTSGLTFGTNGFRLAFADSGAIGDDTSGNTNDWTANNLAATDVVPDSPTNNFAVVPSTTLPSTGYSQHTEGNLQLYQPSWGGWDINLANFHLPSSGKYYWEIMPVQGIFNNGFGGFVFGIGNIRGRENISGYPAFGNPLIQVDSRGIGDYRQYPTWVTYTISGNFGFTVGSTVYGIAVDCDNKKFWFSLNNSWAGTSGTTLTAGTGDPANGTNGDPISGDMTDYVPFFNLGDQQSSCRLGINFGQDSTFAGAKSAGGNTDANGYGDFQYAPPSGFLALCSANLPKGAIDTLNDETPEDYFNTVLWTGDNTNNRSITGVGFQPSLVSAKSRPANSGFNWVDAVRGGTKNLQSNTTSAEATTNTVISFDSDGFTVGDGNGFDINKSGESIVGWSWKANGAGVSNTDGTIASTVSVGATSQQNWFSIVNYTGAGSVGTVGHGLGVTPDMYIVKNRDQAGDWCVYHKDMNANPEQYYMLLNLTNSPIDNNTIWNDTAPTSTTFSIGSYLYGNNVKYVAYCFANAENLCKVGSYTGNGSADGSFIYTGFRPAYLLIKETSNANSWELFDTARDPDNIASQRLFPNSSQAEATTASLDMISNGFKFRVGNTGINRSGGSYIYLAIAEQPFKYANAR